MAQQHEAAAAAATAGKDLYAILGLHPSASEADIKKAYREQALRWHPDKAGAGADAKQRFQAISEAHEVLTDGEGKRWYDYIRATMRPPPPPPPSQHPTHSQASWGAGTYTYAPGNFTAGRARANSAEFYPQAFAPGYARGYTYAQVHGATVSTGVGYVNSPTAGYRKRPSASAEVPPQMHHSSPTASVGSRAVPEATRGAATVGSSPQGWPHSQQRAAEVDPGVQHSAHNTYARAKAWPPSHRPAPGEVDPGVQHSPPTTSTRSKAAPEGMRRAATARTVPQAQGWQPSQRLTAAEVHPEGFDQPDFLATLGDLRALATFLYGGRSWKPQQVFGIEWGRSSSKPRDMKLNFTAEYLVPSAVARSSPEFDLQNTAVREALSRAFQANLKEMLGSTVQSVSSLTVSPPLGTGNGLKTGGIPFSFIIALEGEPDSVLLSFRRARASGPAMKAKDCPIM